MTLTIDIPEKIVQRAEELRVPVSTLVSQSLDALAADPSHRLPPMIDFSHAHRIPEFSGPTAFTKAERAEIDEFRRMADEHMERVTRTPEAARQELIDAGIYQADGQLCEQYR